MGGTVTKREPIQGKRAGRVGKPIGLEEEDHREGVTKCTISVCCFRVCLAFVVVVVRSAFSPKEKPEKNEN